MTPQPTYLKKLYPAPSDENEQYQEIIFWPDDYTDEQGRPPITVIYGENGTGKTELLKYIAKQNPAVTSYPAYRRNGKGSIEDWKYIDIFNGADLISPQERLMQMDYASKLDNHNATEYLAKVKTLLIQIIPGLTDINFKILDNDYNMNVVCDINGEKDVPLYKISYGYQLVIGLVIDYASRLIKHYSSVINNVNDIFAAKEICLIDEVDVHLDIFFQEHIVYDLQKCFPKTQFIVTTHSPATAEYAKHSSANIIFLINPQNHANSTTDEQK